MFKGDVHADRGRLRALVDDALGAGLFELYVPEVVLMELDKQFRSRSKKAVRELRKAMGEFDNEFVELGLPSPTKLSHDVYDANGYRAALEKRLTDAGASILPIPTDLSRTVEWAVQRRKPFKSSGEGQQDAAIWLTVLELATNKNSEIVLVTSNTKDFGEGKSPVKLAAELRKDLTELGLDEDLVRLVPGVDAFADEISAHRKAAVNEAAALAKDGKFDNGIIKALEYQRHDQDLFDLGVELDDDPQITGWTQDELEIDNAAKLPGGSLTVDATAQGSLHLDLMIFKGDYFAMHEDDQDQVVVTDFDYNDHYLEAYGDVSVEIELRITTNADGADVDIEVLEISLSDDERISRALRGRSKRDLIDLLAEQLPVHGVDTYLPSVGLDNGIDEAVVLTVYPYAEPDLIEIVDARGDSLTCALDCTIEADVQWSVMSPTPFEADHHQAIALNTDSDAPFIQDVEERTPLVVDFSATFEPYRGWRDVEVNHVALSGAELDARRNLAAPSDDLMEH